MRLVQLRSPGSNNNSLIAVFPTVAVYLRPWKTGLRTQKVVLLISSNIVRTQLLVASKIRAHGPCFYFHHDRHDRHDEYIHVDHLGDRIGQSNRLRGYPILLQPHLCKIKYLNEIRDKYTRVRTYTTFYGSKYILARDSTLISEQTCISIAK